MKISIALSTFLVSSLILLASFAPAFVLSNSLLAPDMNVAGINGSSVSSTNWSGYAVTGPTGSVTTVSGSWIVPAVTGTNTAFVANWVGIDGYSSSTVEQTGTLSATGNYQAYGITTAYSAWYEFYPAGMVIISNPVLPGDVLYATVTCTGTSGAPIASDLLTPITSTSLASTPITSNAFVNRFPGPSKSSSTFVVTITDYGPYSSTGSYPAYVWTYSHTGTVTNAARSSAEWIVEAPSSSSGVLPLATFSAAPFGQVNTRFTSSPNCYATVSSKNAPIGSFSYNTITMVKVTGSFRHTTTTPIATPSALDSTGTSFTVTEP